MNRPVYRIRRWSLIARVAWSMASARTLPLLARHALQRAVNGDKYPGYGILGMTNACDCNCGHCYAYLYRKHGRKDELSTAEWLDVLRQIRAMKVPRVHFSGGEPTLREDLPELVAKAYELGIAGIVETNGQHLTDEMVGRLKRAHIGGIVVSFDSSFAEVHDRIRHREGCFETAVAAIKRAVSTGIPCVISTFANREKLVDGDLEGLMKLGRDTGAMAVRLIPPISSGRWIDDPMVRLSADDAAEIERRLDPSIGYFRGMYFGSGCAALERGTFYVAPTGDIQPCAVVPLSFGTVRDEPLEAILRHIWEHPMCGVESDGCVMNNERFRSLFDDELGQTTLPAPVVSPEADDAGSADAGVAR